MIVDRKLIAGVALGALAAASAAHAAPAKHAKHRVVHATASTAPTAELMAEVKALRAQVETLQSRLDGQTGSQQATAEQLQSTQARIEAVQAKVDATDTKVAAIPTAVNTAVDKATDKARHADKFYFKGITITPGGFLELAGIYRNRFQGDDIASSFNIPFPGQSHQSFTPESRFSARQSRLSFLAQGAPSEHTLLSMYGEFDFQGAAQTSNSNQSNSYVPRIRNVYGTVDWNRGDYGLHFLAGQNWSLLTMNSKGITPRNEVTPPQIDAQYVPGFAWARQPGVRVAADFLDHKLWIAASAENAQTTFGGTGAPGFVAASLPGQSVSATLNCTTPNVTSTCTIATATAGAPPGSFQQFYNGVGGSLSLNRLPDFIVKAAYELSFYGHGVHLEAFGIFRSFNDHFDGAGNDKTDAFGYGGSINAQIVPKVLDVQFSGIGGRGIGRYGSAGLPDVTFDKEGAIHPISEVMYLGGVTLHATKMLDVYGFAGEELEFARLYDGGTSGYGVPTANNSGCFVETLTTSTTSPCGGNTRRIRQLTGGFWDKFYQGPFGRAQVGLQYSYTERQLFAGVGGAPQTHNNMVFVSFRYYPF